VYKNVVDTLINGLKPIVLQDIRPNVSGRSNCFLSFLTCYQNSGREREVR
jgi:hypothetical protein